VKVKQVSEELGVRYVLEGSVRREGERVRITAQLIDEIKGHHFVAERYDRETKEIFALQDEITMKIMTALKCDTAGRGQFGKGLTTTRSLDAFLNTSRRVRLFYRYTKKIMPLARRLLEEVISLDPDYSPAYSLLAATHASEVWFGTSKSPRIPWRKPSSWGRRPLRWMNRNADAHSGLGYHYVMAKQFDKAIAQTERALSLDPTSSANPLQLCLQSCLFGKAKGSDPSFSRGLAP